MTCKKNVQRIEEICSELLELIDDSRAQCDHDECELIHCVVHDSVQNMRRVIDQQKPDDPIRDRPDLTETGNESRRPVN